MGGFLILVGETEKFPNQLRKNFLTASYKNGSMLLTKRGNTPQLNSLFWRLPMHPKESYQNNESEIPTLMLSALLGKSSDWVNQVLKHDLAGVIPINQHYIFGEVISNLYIPALLEYDRLLSWGLSLGAIEDILVLMQLIPQRTQSVCEVSSAVEEVLAKIPRKRLTNTEDFTKPLPSGYLKYEEDIITKGEERLHKRLTLDIYKMVDPLRRPSKTWVMSDIESYYEKNIPELLHGASSPHRAKKYLRVIPYKTTKRGNIYSSLDVSAMVLFSLVCHDLTYFNSKDCALITECVFMREVAYHWNCSSQIRFQTYSDSEGVTIRGRIHSPDLDEDLEERVDSEEGLGLSPLLAKGFSMQEVKSMSQTTFNQMKENGYVA